jgi:hypothetical protein
VQVVVFPGVQSHLRTEPVEPTEKCIGAPLRGGWSRLQDQRWVRYNLSVFSLVFHINLFVTLYSMLQKKSIRVEPYYLDDWLPAHDNDEAKVEKLVSNNIKCYV